MRRGFIDLVLLIIQVRCKICTNYLEWRVVHVREL